MEALQLSGITAGIFAVLNAGGKHSVIPCLDSCQKIALQTTGGQAGMTEWGDGFIEYLPLGG